MRSPPSLLFSRRNTPGSLSCSFQDFWESSPLQSIPRGTADPVWLFLQGLKKQGHTSPTEGLCVALRGTGEPDPQLAWAALHSPGLIHTSRGRARIAGHTVSTVTATHCSNTIYPEAAKCFFTEQIFVHYTLTVPLTANSAIGRWINRCCTAEAAPQQPEPR